MRTTKKQTVSILCTALLLAACDAPEDVADGASAESNDTDFGGVDSTGEDYDAEDESGSSGGPDFELEEPTLTFEGDPQGITTDFQSYWGTPGNSGPLADLGSDVNRTCFLTGVTGDLEGAYQGTRASARVFQQAGRWKVQTIAGTGGAGVVAHFACIPTANNLRILSWVGNTTSTPNDQFSWLEDTGSTKCFLASVSGSVGWASANSYALVRKKTIYGFGAPFAGWHLTGNLLVEQDGTSGGSAAAVCVDMSFQTTKTVDFAAYGATGWIMPSSGTTCGAEGFAGNFAAAPGGWFDGANIFLDSSINWWKVSADEGKNVKGTCYKNFVFRWPW